MFSTKQNGNTSIIVRGIKFEDAVGHEVFRGRVLRRAKGDPVPSKRKPSTPLSIPRATVKSRFVEMFGDPIENNSKLPKYKWEDVLTIVNGKNQKKVECATGEYPICGSGGEMGRAKQYLTKGDSVIIGRKGNINNPILMREPFWNVDTAFGLEPNADMLIVEYLYYYCEWFDFQKLNKAVTIPSLTKADLLKIEMPLPPLALQQKFADFVAQVDKLRFEACYAMYLLCAAFTLL